MVRYDKDISPSAKIIYSEISALSNSRGYCFASNRYFSEAFQVSISSVSKWIHQLYKKGYINIEYCRNGQHIKSRKIYINPQICSSLEFVNNHSITFNTPSDLSEATLPCNTKGNTHVNNTQVMSGIYGELQNVFLSDDEYRKMIRRCGKEQTMILINDLSFHIGSTGRKYKSHYYTLLSWYRKKVKKGVTNPSSWYVNPDGEKEEE